MINISSVGQIERAVHTPGFRSDSWFSLDNRVLKPKSFISPLRRVRRALQLLAVSDAVKLHNL